MRRWRFDGAAYPSHGSSQCRTELAARDKSGPLPLQAEPDTGSKLCSSFGEFSC